MERYIILCLSFVQLIEGQQVDLHCPDGSPAPAACNTGRGNSDCHRTLTSIHYQCCPSTNQISVTGDNDGVCCLDTLQCTRGGKTLSSVQMGKGGAAVGGIGQRTVSLTDRFGGMTDAVGALIGGKGALRSRVSQLSREMTVGRPGNFDIGMGDSLGGWSRTGAVLGQVVTDSGGIVSPGAGPGIKPLIPPGGMARRGTRTGYFEGSGIIGDTIPPDMHCPGSGGPGSGGAPAKGFCNDNSDCPSGGIHYPCLANILPTMVNGFRGLCCDPPHTGSVGVSTRSLAGASIYGDRSAAVMTGVLGAPGVGGISPGISERIDPVGMGTMAAVSRMTMTGSGAGGALLPGSGPDMHCPGGPPSKGYCNTNNDCPSNGVHYPCYQGLLSQPVNGFHGLCCDRNIHQPGRGKGIMDGTAIVDTMGPGGSVLDGSVITDSRRYTHGGIGSPLDVAPVNILGDRGVIGTGTAIISEATNPVGGAIVGVPNTVGSTIGSSRTHIRRTGIIEHVHGASPVAAITPGLVSNAVLCPDGSPHVGFCRSYVQCEDQYPGVAYRCLSNSAALRLSGMTGICCRTHGSVIGIGSEMIGLAGVVGTGTSVLGFANAGTGAPGSDRAARLCQMFNEEPKFHSDGRPDRCTTQYPSCPGSNVHCRFYTDIPNEGTCCERVLTPARGIVSEPHRPVFHGETICYRLRERPYRLGSGALARCTMHNPTCPGPSVCRRTYMSHWGTCCVRGPRRTRDMLAGVA